MKKDKSFRINRAQVCAINFTDAAAKNRKQLKAKKGGTGGTSASIYQSPMHALKYKRIRTGILFPIQVNQAAGFRRRCDNNLIQFYLSLRGFTPY